MSSISGNYSVSTVIKDIDKAYAAMENTKKGKIQIVCCNPQFDDSTKHFVFTYLGIISGFFFSVLSVSHLKNIKPEIKINERIFEYLLELKNTFLMKRILDVTTSQSIINTPITLEGNCVTLEEAFETFPLTFRTPVLLNVAISLTCCLLPTIAFPLANLINMTKWKSSPLSLKEHWKLEKNLDYVRNNPKRVSKRVIKDIESLEQCPDSTVIERGQMVSTYQWKTYRAKTRYSINFVAIAAAIYACYLAAAYLAGKLLTHDIANIYENGNIPSNCDKNSLILSYSMNMQSKRVLLPGAVEYLSKQPPIYPSQENYNTQLGLMTIPMLLYSAITLSTNIMLTIMLSKRNQRQ